MTDTRSSLQVTAAAIALALGWRVELKRGYPTVCLRATDDSGHSLYLRDDKGRIEIHPYWPMETPNGPEMFPRSWEPKQDVISVAATRQPAEIAREIERRFLPGYIKAFAVQMQRKRETEAYTDTTAANVARIKAATGARDYGTQHCPTDHSLTVPENHVHQIRVMGDSVRFEFFSVPVAVALTIIEAARKAGA